MKQYEITTPTAKDARRMLAAEKMLVREIKSGRGCVTTECFWFDTGAALRLALLFDSVRW